MPTSRTLDDLPVLSSLSSSDILHARHAGTDSSITLSVLFTSPALTGVPTAPTAADGTNTTQIATTAFVLANAGGVGGVVWGDITGTVSDQTDLGSAATLNFDTDPTLAADTDSLISTQKAVKAYVDDTLSGALTGKENDLSTPAEDGYVLSSTTGGTRSWIEPPSGSIAWGDIAGTLSDQSDLNTSLDNINVELAMVGGYMGCWNFTYTSSDPASSTGAATFDGFGSTSAAGSLKLYYSDADGFSWQGLWGGATEIPKVGSLIGLRSKDGTGASQYGLYPVLSATYLDPFLNISLDSPIILGLSSTNVGDEMSVAFHHSNSMLITQTDLNGVIAADTGWVANDDAGDKTLVIPTASSVASGRAAALTVLDPSSMNGVADYFTYIDKAVEKIKAIEAILALNPPKRPNA